LVGRIADLKCAHNSGSLHHAQLERARKPQHIAPVFFNQLRIDRVTRDPIEQTVVSRCIDSPMPSSADIGNPGTAEPPAVPG
jgi:hypothetical protein